MGLTQTHLDTIDTIVRKHGNYPSNAYLEVFDGLAIGLGRIETRRHITPAELVDGVVESAIEKYGALAESVLTIFGFRTPQDVGRAVDNLVRYHLFVYTSNTPEKFDMPSINLPEAAKKKFYLQLELNPPSLLSTPVNPINR